MIRSIRVPSSLSPERAEAELARTSARSFAGDNDIWLYRDFSGVEGNLDDLREILEEQNASFEVMEATFAAIAAEEAAIGAHNLSPSWEEKRAAWAAWEAACRALVALR
jgi:hypothetical protein